MGGHFGTTQNYEMKFSLPFDEAFALVERAAMLCGKITQSNKSLGIIQFKASSGLSNTVKFSANVSKNGDSQSVLRLAASCCDGMVGMNSVGRTYNKFVECISKAQGLTSMPQKKRHGCLTALLGVVIAFFVFVIAIGTIMDNHTSSPSDTSQPIETGSIISINDIPNYRFGPVLLDSFNSIGATDIVDAVCEVSNSYGTTFKVETDGPTLWVSLKQSYSDEEWYVAWIKDYDSQKLYYCNENEKYTPSGLLKENIYSFETGEIVEQADMDAVKAYYNQLEEDRAKEAEKREQQIREDASALFHEIRVAYKNNELSADDTYKGNRYTIVGQFDAANEDGIFPSLLNEINITVKIMDGNTTCYVFCSFDKEEWRDRLAELNKGDEMVIEGECYGWGSWSDCELKS